MHKPSVYSLVLIEGRTGKEDVKVSMDVNHLKTYKSNKNRKYQKVHIKWPINRYVQPH